MFKKLIVTSLLALSANVYANYDAPVYYKVYNYADCVMVDDSLETKGDWFNAENIIANRIYPAVMLTHDPAEKADMTVYELQKIAGEYYANVNSEEDLQLAKSCGSLTPEEIN